MYIFTKISYLIDTFEVLLTSPEYEVQTITVNTIDS